MAEHAHMATPIFTSENMNLTIYQNWMKQKYGMFRIYSYVFWVKESIPSIIFKFSPSGMELWTTPIFHEAYFWPKLKHANV